MMVTATTARLHAWAERHLTTRTVRRGAMAGGVWGLAMGAILAAGEFLACGTLCLPDVVATTALAMAAGVLTIGPLAAFGARPA